MVSKEQRRHELARAKLARQQARREAEARRRKLTAIIAAGVAVLVVVGGISYLAFVDSGDDVPAAEGTTTPGPTETEDGRDTPRSGACRYRPSGDAAKPVDRPPNGRPAELLSASATIVTDQGTIEIELDPLAAPCAVQSFLHLAEASYFDSTMCHRLTMSESLQVLQCGDPTATGTGGPGYTFADEVSDDLTYTRGTVAMANSGPDTNGSQFFLVYGNSQLPPDYTVFGQITGGLDVLDAVAAAGIAEGTESTPATSVTITSVTVTYEAATPAPPPATTSTPLDTSTPVPPTSTAPPSTDPTTSSVATSTAAAP